MSYITVPLRIESLPAWSTETDTFSGRVEGITYDPNFLVGPSQYDLSGCTIPRETALEPFKNSTDEKMAKAYSYWMNETWNEQDAHMRYTLQKNYTAEIQTIRSHLWTVIHNDLNQQLEARKMRGNCCSNNCHKTVAIVMLIATVTFLSIYFGIK